MCRFFYMLKVLVTENVNRYFQVLSSEEKYEISKEIVDSILHSWGGRFLKRGNNCWLPINPSDARKKVAQALQYQRRKNAKQDIFFDDRGSLLAGTAGDFGTAPPPPKLYRHEPFIPSISKFPESNNAELSCSKYQQPPLELVRSCALVQAKSKKNSKLDKMTSSLYNSSIVQASANANIATCGKPTYSENLNSLKHLIAKSRPKARMDSIGQSNTSTVGSQNELTHPQQEMEFSHQSTISCVTTSLYMDSSGEFSLPDADITLTNEYFEQHDESS
jgi:hypothetical protein